MNLGKISAKFLRGDIVAENLACYQLNIILNLVLGMFFHLIGRGLRCGAALSPILSLAVGISDKRDGCSLPEI